MGTYWYSLWFFPTYGSYGVSSYGHEKCDPNVVADLNKRINEALSKYPEVPLAELRLTVIHNAECRLLSNLYIKCTIDKAEYEEIEKSLEDFLEKAAGNYEVIPAMEQAVKELMIIQEDRNLPKDVQVDAFKLRVNIKFSKTASEAKEFLNNYEDFKKEHNIVPPNGKQDEAPMNN